MGLRRLLSQRHLWRSDKTGSRHTFSQRKALADLGGLACSRTQSIGSVCSRVSICCGSRCGGSDCWNCTIDRLSLDSLRGPVAEQLHDQVDGFLEANDQYGVVTTWHDGPTALEDAIEFIEFAGLAPVGVVRVRCDDPWIVERTLKTMGLVPPV